MTHRTHSNILSEESPSPVLAVFVALAALWLSVLDSRDDKAFWRFLHFVTFPRVYVLRLILRRQCAAFCAASGLNSSVNRRLPHATRFPVVRAIGSSFLFLQE